MNTRIFHGNVTPEKFSQALIARFNQGNLQAQQFGRGKKIIVQITTRKMPSSGGRTALTVDLEQVADGVSVQLGKQNWLGVAASLGQTALATWRNPWGLLTRLDDLAQDIEYFQLSDDVWEVVQSTAHSAGASFELSERLRSLVCLYCDTANPVGEPNCVACGAPLGKVQPTTCNVCGYVIKYNESTCPNCGKAIT